MTQNISEKAKKAILIAADLGTHDVDCSLKELRELFETTGGTFVCEVVQKREKIEPATYIGAGKLIEVKEFMEMYDADLVICDDELTAVQLRSIEEILSCPVIDRTTVILDIFARRAVTKEGAVQVELAQYKYRLPRLYGMGRSLSRLGGGIGTRGPGESKLETDRRHIMRRIHSLEKELSVIEQQRMRITERRRKNEVPVIALAGYTNAGKSTLLNAVTGSDVFSADQLFATLDPTARKFLLPEGTQAVMIDTVGFLQRIPHHLIEAFKSTLQHLSQADLIVVVLDAADPNKDLQKEITLQMLADLGCAQVPRIVALNKCDLLTEIPPIRRQKESQEIYISARLGEGLTELKEMICKELDLYTVEADFFVPYSNGKEQTEFLKQTISHNETYLEDGVLIRAVVRKSVFEKYRKFVQKAKWE